MQGVVYLTSSRRPFSCNGAEVFPAAADVRNSRGRGISLGAGWTSAGCRARDSLDAASHTGAGVSDLVDLIDILEDPSSGRLGRSENVKSCRPGKLVLVKLGSGQPVVEAPKAIKIFNGIPNRVVVKDIKAWRA